jgi:Ser/Thr protein kinase RdoA (MazF antagonist)
MALAALACPGLVVVRRLDDNWHGDAHWLVQDPASSQRFGLRAVRVGRAIRWEERRRQGAAVLGAQLDAGDAFVGAGIPFMARAAGPAIVEDSAVVLFRWLDGDAVVTSDIEHATAIGELLRRMHSSQVPVNEQLPVHDLVAAAERSIAELGDLADAHFLSKAHDTVARLRPRTARRVVVHGDLNFPNVLWASDRIAGIVDFDQIGLGDPHEELAWVIKWWSRRGPIGSLDHDARLAGAVLRAYDEHVDREVLAAQLWVAGCLNGNSALRVRRAARREQAHLLRALVGRADRLADLV